MQVCSYFMVYLEPETAKPIPAEMLKRPQGHDFGMKDYIN